MKKLLPSGRVIRLGMLLWLSSASAAVLALLTQIGIARKLQPDDFGDIASLLTIYMIVGTLGHLGLGNLLIRKSAESPAENQRWAKATIRTAVGLTLVATALIVAAAAAHGLRGHYRALLLLPVAYSYTFSELAIARFQILERLGRVAALQCAPNLLRLLLSVAALHFFGDGFSVAVALGLASATAAAVSLLSFTRTLRAEAGSARLPILQLLGQTWPYGLSMAVYIAYSQGGVLMLRWFDTTASAGNFALAANLLSAVYLLPFAVFQRLNAKQVAIWSASSSVRLLPYLKKVVAVSAATGLLISMALVGLADRVVSFLFGAAYQGAGQLLGVVAFAIPFRFIATAAGATLNSHADTRLRLMTQLAVLAAFLAGAWLALRLVAFESVLAVGGVYVICELVLSSLYLRAAWARATAHSQTAMAS